MNFCTHDSAQFSFHGVNWFLQVGHMVAMNGNKCGQFRQLSLYAVLRFMGFLDFVHLICIQRRGVGRQRDTCMYTHKFQHNHCLYSRQMPQWETTSSKFLVNKTVPSAWSLSHRKSLFVRHPPPPPKKNWIPRHQVWAVWWMFQHFPPTIPQPHCGHLAGGGGVAWSWSMITPRLSHLQVPSSKRFPQPALCAAAILTVLLLDRKLGL